MIGCGIIDYMRQCMACMDISTCSATDYMVHDLESSYCILWQCGNIFCMVMSIVSSLAACYDTELCICAQIGLPT